MTEELSEDEKNMIAWLETQGPDVLHFVSHNLNWDFAEGVVNWIVAQSDCDLATAIDMFWKNNPNERLKFPNRAAVEANGKFWEVDPFIFCETILNRYAVGGYPRSEYTTDSYNSFMLGYYEEDEKRIGTQNLPWRLPDAFRHPIKGIDLLTTEMEVKYLTPDLKARLEKFGVYFV